MEPNQLTVDASIKDYEKDNYLTSAEYIEFLKLKQKDQKKADEYQQEVLKKNRLRKALRQ